MATTDQAEGKYFPNTVLAYVKYACSQSTRDNLLTVIDSNFTDLEIDAARNMLWRVAGTELLGECPGRSDSSNRTKRYVMCCDIYDGMRKLDLHTAGNPVSYFVVHPHGIGRLPRYNPEELNVAAMDQRIRDLETKYRALDATLSLKCSAYDAIQDGMLAIQLDVERNANRLRCRDNTPKHNSAAQSTPAQKNTPVLSASPLNDNVPSVTVLSTCTTGSNEGHAVASTITTSAHSSQPVVSSAQRDTPTCSCLTSTATTITDSSITGNTSANTTNSIPNPPPQTPVPGSSSSTDTKQKAAFNTVAGDLQENPGDIQNKDKYKTVSYKRKGKSGKSTSGNAFSGAPPTRNVFLYRCHSSTTEQEVITHMNGKQLKYNTIRTMSNPGAQYKSFLIVVNSDDFLNTSDGTGWPYGTKTKEFRMPKGGLKNNNGGLFS